MDEEETQTTIADLDTVIQQLLLHQHNTLEAMMHRDIDTALLTVAKAVRTCLTHTNEPETSPNKGPEFFGSIGKAGQGSERIDDYSGVPIGKSSDSKKQQELPSTTPPDQTDVYKVVSDREWELIQFMRRQQEDKGK